MTFHRYSEEILKEYLGTVAYVDDLIFSKREETKAVGLKIESPRVMAAKKDEEQPLPKQETEGKNTDNKSDAPIKQLEPNINPAAFTNAFLERGIHCSLFEVENDEDSLDFLKNILKKSDVVILDWQMHHDDGRKARELLLSVIQSSHQPELRLFVIFTDDKRYKTLLRESILPELKEKGIIQAVPEDIECVFNFGHSKILVLEKVNGKKSETTISDEELPDKIIEEFAKITSGLVSNSVLKAVSVIRRNSHSLLATFNKNLDPAYLAHRAMLPFPDDAELLLREIIVDSISSMIAYSNVIDSCSIEKIEEWINESSFDDREVNLATGKAPDNKINISKEDLKYWQRNGYQNFIPLIVKNQKTIQLKESEFNSFEKMKLRNKATECFVPNDIKLDGQSEEFAILTHHKSNFITPSYIPSLTLGTIVQKNDEYFLCIQQRCDSVRIKEDEIRKFLFLPLGEKEGSFPIVLRNDEREYILRKVNLSNCHYLLVERFRQSNHGIVEAKQEGEIFYFYDVDEHKFKWILDLKESHAQRIANKFAAELSRVGLDESEWLRRS